MIISILLANPGGIGDVAMFVCGINPCRVGMEWGYCKQ
ncbi:hypothetical protein M2138_001053 [Dysgonomonadaceae bacterium PH5-43]|nr:hypothetical protein [Dysgonomonadaceae bacterium PH5-43]